VRQSPNDDKYVGPYGTKYGAAVASLHADATTAVRRQANLFFQASSGKNAILLSVQSLFSDNIL
jgi:hypothetical protein